jgi:NAD(P)-dependent dehydrogenase (short-subunit alcohol dehydrogenase family)
VDAADQGPGRLWGRRVLVTGASRGIGAAFAQRAAAEGADVAIVARTGDRHDHLSGSLNETAERLRLYGNRVAVIVADLADAERRERVVPEAVEGLGGPIDVLVNNAAAAIYASPTEYSLRRRQLTFEVNVHAPLDLIQDVLPGMVDRGEGWIVNVSSSTARHITGPPFDASANWPTMTRYGASKAALNRQTNGLGIALWGTGVRVNTVQPRTGVYSEGAEALVGGIVDTSGWESMEEMVEGVLALCDCAENVTGGVHVSTEVVAQLCRPVRGLDGRSL